MEKQTYDTTSGRSGLPFRSNMTAHKTADYVELVAHSTLRFIFQQAGDVVYTFC